MSYENFVGTYDLTKGSGIYPNSWLALRHLQDVFQDEAMIFFFSVRSLDTFLESGYRQLILTRKETRDFDEYLAEIDLDALSWLPVIEALIQTSNLVYIWPYELFRDKEFQIWRVLLNCEDPNALLPNPARKLNHSLSDKGMEYMLGINRVAHSNADAKRFRSVMLKHFGVDAGQKATPLLPDWGRQPLVHRYEQELAMLQEATDPRMSTV
jgi:hypothetical protein